MSNLKNTLTINKKVSVIDFLNKLKNEYIKISKEKEEQTINYINNLLFYNRLGYKYYKANYSLRDAYKREYNYILSVCDYINKQSVSAGYVPIFVTLTLPTQFHPTTTKGGKRKYNPNFKFSGDFGDFVKEGYKTLQYCFRVIVKNLTRGNRHKGIKLPYFKVVEMHKDFTPHLHVVFFVKKSELIDKYLYLLETIAKLIKEQKLGEQFKIELLRDTRKGAAYVQKYLRKAYLSDNEDKIYLLDGWRKLNKIRMFTHSQTYLKKEDFIKILPDFIKHEEQKIKDGL